MSPVVEDLGVREVTAGPSTEERRMFVATNRMAFGIVLTLVFGVVTTGSAFAQRGAERRRLRAAEIADPVKRALCTLISPIPSAG